MKKYGFSRKERILSPGQYNHVYQRGQVKKSTLLWCYYLPNKLGFSRLGISVSNRKCANIVLRNRLKKIVREVFRLNKINLTTQNDIIFVLKAQIKHIEFNCLQESILNLLKKAGLQ
ncbi:MAG: ribonuclease P protein component [Candidatus Omnitrophota bacterium]